MARRPQKPGAHHGPDLERFMSTRHTLLASLILLAAAGSAFAQAAPAPSAAAAPVPAATGNADALEGKLAWYGRKFAGRKTASGQRFDPNALTMAHRTLPFGTRVKVTNIANQRSVVVGVNDRGPMRADRIGDVSQAAAKRLGMLRAGTVDATLEVLR